MTSQKYKDVAAAVWPNIDELLMRYPETRLIPDSLRQRLKERWAKGALDYPSGRLHEDGRHINGCMETNSWRDAEEEVVDAVFNLLVQNFKKPLKGGVQRGMVGMLVMLHAMLVKEGKL